MQNNNHKKLFLITTVIVLAVVIFCYLFFHNKVSKNNLLVPNENSESSRNEITATSSEIIATSTIISITHMTTPEPLKGLYMTSWVAGTKTMRDHIITIAEKTEINAVVVDLKDYSGRIAYPVDNSTLQSIGSAQKRIPNLKELTNLLHSKHIYVIGRVACFQDPYFATLHPEYAIKTASNTSMIWKDKSGLSWLDPGEQPVWDYLITISNDAYAQGVDEIQFDYTRFPSDGNLKHMYYPSSEGKERSDVINSFWVYVNQHLHGTGPVLSVDLFGLATTAKDDMGIGQIIENALRNFDYVSPMVYPSHFAAHWDGFLDPQAHPYEVIKTSMGNAVERAKVIEISPSKLRPWLQDFGLFGETYGPKQVREQITATNDVGLTSWLLWDPSNVFTIDALLPKNATSTVSLKK
ncbi:MAG: putative glycoside hydrolase [bacterium]